MAFLLRAVVLLWCFMYSERSICRVQRRCQASEVRSWRGRVVLYPQGSMYHRLVMPTAQLCMADTVSVVLSAGLPDSLFYWSPRCYTAAASTSLESPDTCVIVCSQCCQHRARANRCLSVIHVRSYMYLRIYSQWTRVPSIWVWPPVLVLSQQWRNFKFCPPPAENAIWPRSLTTS